MRRDVGIPPYGNEARPAAVRRDVGTPPYGNEARPAAVRRDVDIPPYGLAATKGREKNESWMFSANLLNQTQEIKSGRT